MGNRKRISSNKKKINNKYLGISKILKYPRSAKKVRRITNLLIGKTVKFALSYLDNCFYVSALDIKKLILSAVSNFNNLTNNNIIINNLFIKNILVNNGSMIKKIRPVSKGMTHVIKKRTCHIIVLIDK